MSHEFRDIAHGSAAVGLEAPGARITVFDDEGAWKRVHRDDPDFQKALGKFDWKEEVAVYFEPGGGPGETLSLEHVRRAGATLTLELRVKRSRDRAQLDTVEAPWLLAAVARAAFEGATKVTLLVAGEDAEATVTHEK